MQITEYMRYIADTLPDDALVVSSHTNNDTTWISMKKPNPRITDMNMGLASGVALGLALALPHRRVLGLDSDGGVMLYTNILQDLAYQRPPNLIVVIHDNGLNIEFPSSTARGSDIEAMARGAGIRRAQTVRTLEEFKKAFSEALSRKEMAYIVAKSTTIRNRKPEGQIHPTDWESTINFVRRIEEMEGKTIVLPREQPPM